MDNLNKELLAKNLIAFGEMFDKPVSTQLMGMYYQALSSMTDAEFLQAVSHVMNTHKFNTLPKPADFINAIKGDSDVVCLNVWDKIVNAMARVGAYKTVVFDDSLIHGFIESYSYGHEKAWPALCHTDHEKLVWVRKEFERYYVAMQGVNITVRPLLGITEGHDVTLGHDGKRDIVYIGDKSKCLALIDESNKADSVMKRLEV